MFPGTNPVKQNASAHQQNKLTYIGIHHFEENLFDQGCIPLIYVLLFYLEVVTVCLNLSTAGVTTIYRGNFINSRSGFGFYWC